MACFWYPTALQAIYISMFHIQFYSNDTYTLTQQAAARQCAEPSTGPSCSLQTLPQITNSYQQMHIHILKYCGPGSSVGIATDYGMDGLGSNPVGTRFSALQTGPGAHSASCTMGTGSFSGVKCGRGAPLTTHPLLVPRSWKSRAIPLPTLWATPGL